MIDLETLSGLREAFMEAADCEHFCAERTRLGKSWQEVHAGQYRYARDLYEEWQNDTSLLLIVQRYAARKSHLARARFGIEPFEEDVS